METKLYITFTCINIIRAVIRCVQNLHKIEIRIGTILWKCCGEILRTSITKSKETHKEIQVEETDEGKKKENEKKKLPYPSN